MRWPFILFTACLSIISLQAQTSTIAGVMLTPGGQPVTGGTIFVTNLSPFTTSGANFVPAQTQQFSIGPPAGLPAGQYSFSLFQNTGSSPASFYQLTFGLINGAQTAPLTCIVTSSSPQTIQQICAINPPSPGAVIPLQFLSNSGGSVGNCITLVSQSGILVPQWATCSGGGGGGITSINADSTAAQTLTKTNDTNLTLTIVDNAAGDHKFNLGWTGTLAKGRNLATAVYTDQNNTFSTGFQDFGSVNHFRPLAGILLSIPATCSVGEVYIATNATAGQNWYFCTSTNNWTQQLNSGGGGVTNPLYGGSGVGSTFEIDGTSNGSPSNAYLKLQTNGQSTLIGCTGSPDSPFEIRISTGCAPSPAPPAGTKLHFVGANNINTLLILDAFGTGFITGFPSIGLRRTDNTIASPSGLKANDVLGDFFFSGYGTTNYITGPQIIGHASQDWSDTQAGSYLSFNVVPNGSTGSIQALQLQQDGSMQLGQFSDVTLSRGNPNELDCGTVNLDKTCLFRPGITDSTTGFRQNSLAPMAYLLRSINGSYFTAQPPTFLNPVDFNFPAIVAPGGNLIGGVPATVTINAPYGVNGSDTLHPIRISAGTGTAETPLITGGTCTGGAAGCTLSFTPANNHTGAWTITSASAGIAECINHSCSGAGSTNPPIKIPAGTYPLYATIYVPCNIDISGAGPFATALQAQGATISHFDIVNARVNISDLGLTATTPQTTGNWGIRLGNGGGNENSFSHFDRIYYEPLWDAILAINADQYWVTDSVFYNFQHTAITANSTTSPDSDGPWITDNVMFNYLPFATPALACLNMTATGAITMSGNKCFGTNIGANAQLSYNVKVATTTTTQITLVNNIFETANTNSIDISGVFNLIAITGNTIAQPFTAQNGWRGITINGNNTTSSCGTGIGICSIAISGNTIQGPGATSTSSVGIELVGFTSGANVSSNAINFTQIGINAGANVTATTIGPNQISAYSQPLFGGNANVIWLDAGPMSLAQLPTAANGSKLFCFDCKNVTDDTTGTFDSAAAGSGHGTTVLRENGAWRVH